MEDHDKVVPLADFVAIELRAAAYFLERYVVFQGAAGWYYRRKGQEVAYGPTASESGAWAGVAVHDEQFNNQGERE